MTDRQTRLDYIDSAKGLGMILVVFGHLLLSDSPLYTIIYSFHMPFFFMVSGFFAKPKTKFIPYLVKQIKRLIVPFLIVFVIGVAVTFAIPSLRLDSFSDVLPLLIKARPIEINVGPIWFLACLFDVAIIFYFYYKLILEKNKILLNFISLGVLSIVAFLIPRIESRFGIQMPFKTDVAFMALVFYTIGYLLKEKFLSDEFSKLSWDKIVLILFTLPIVVLMPHYLIGQTFLSGGMFGPDLFWYLFTAFCGSVLLMVLGLLCRKIRVLQYIGKNSLIIFSVHSLVILLFNYILKILGISANLLTSVFGTVFVLIIMLVVSIVYNYCKKLLYYWLGNHN